MDTTVTRILKTLSGGAAKNSSATARLCYRVTTLRPLLVVPGLFCTEIHDDELGYIWGRFGQLYGGPPIGTLDGAARPAQGASCAGSRCCSASSTIWWARSRRRCCEGGYRRGETLHFFAYDWRRPVVDLGVTLAAEVRRLAASLWRRDRHAGAVERRSHRPRRLSPPTATLPVERVVTSGGAHAGTVETLACLDAGFRFAPLGRRVTPEEFMACPGGLDSIPDRRSAQFLPDDAGYDLYDVETWRRLRHVGVPPPSGRPDLDRGGGASGWPACASSTVCSTGRRRPRRLVCICGTGLPTQVRIVVEKGRAAPARRRAAGRALRRRRWTDGDGTIAVEAAHAWAGAEPEVVKIPVTRHRDMVRTRLAFEAILTALR